MRTVDHPFAAGLTVPMSVLGFGCAGLLGRASRRVSLAALHTAFENGITFYDTARSYGYGHSEGLLGEFVSASSRRDQIVVCTKFGIQAAPRNWKQQLRPVARAAVRLVPSLRQAIQRRVANQFEGGRFTVSDLRSSFETSLRELRTSYVDILLLHAAPETVFEQDDLFEALGRLVEEGKVRLAGISADQPVMEHAFAKRFPVLKTAQVALNPSNLAFTGQTTANRDLLLVANHPFAGPAGVKETKARLIELASDATLPADLRNKFADPRDPQLFPELVFGLILSGTGISAVLPAMMQLAHIRSNIAAVESCRFTSEELATLRDRLISIS